MKDQHERLLKAMIPGQWYYTLAKFENDLQRLVNSGCLKKKEGVRGPAYMKPKSPNKQINPSTTADVAQGRALDSNPKVAGSNLPSAFKN